MSSSRDHGHSAGSSVLESVRRAMAMVADLPPEFVIVQHEHMMAGRAWKMRDDGRDYFFVHPDDIKALPLAATPILGAVRVRSFDDEMRAVFIRGLDRMAEAEARLAASRGAI